jgi:hypothetical protein
MATMRRRFVCQVRLKMIKYGSTSFQLHPFLPKSAQASYSTGNERVYRSPLIAEVPPKAFPDTISSVLPPMDSTGANFHLNAGADAPLKLLNNRGTQEDQESSTWPPSSRRTRVLGSFVNREAMTQSEVPPEVHVKMRGEVNTDHRR